MPPDSRAPCIRAPRRNSRLVAIVSGHRKAPKLASSYRLNHAFSYEESTTGLRVVDAAYIALPNLHAEYTIVRRAGVRGYARSRWP